jgi:hypothetical protein
VTPPRTSRALFTPAADTLLRVALVALATTALGVPACLMAWVRTAYSTDALTPRSQPILFDHRHHVRDDGIDCLYCHEGAAKGPYAGVPPIARCMGCHTQIWSDAPILRRLRGAAFGDATLAWTRVHALPAHVFFDHSAHVRRGVGCETCHGRLDRMAQPWAVAPLTMGWCLDCHRDPDPWLREPARATETGIAPDRDRGRAIHAALGIDPPTYCTGCHR